MKNPHGYSCHGNYLHKKAQLQINNAIQGKLDEKV
jgi:hypothetical protein